MFDNGAAVPGEDHRLALEQTTAELSSKQIAEIRDRARSLELPFEFVFHHYHGKLYEMEHARRAKEAKARVDALEIHSIGNDRRPVKINPGEIYEVITRPPWLAFKPGRLEISSAAALWTIKSFKIGNREQLKNGDVPGNLFNEYVAMGHIECETAQTAMDISLLVKWNGEEPAMFEGKFYGRAAI